MVAKKIFHVFVGFWFANVVYVSLYLLGVALYFWLVTTPDDRNTPIFLLLPRFAMILSAPLPLAVGFVIWRSRKYVAIGMLMFAVVSSACWMTIGRSGP